MFQNTPDWTAHVDLTYEFPVTLFDQPGNMSLIGGWSYRGDTNQFEVPSPFLDQDAYSLIDASLIWKPMSGRYEVGLHANNITDQQYRTRATSSSRRTDRPRRWVWKAWPTRSSGRRAPIR